MTKRQQKIHRAVQSRRDEIISDLDRQNIKLGHTLSLRMALGFFDGFLTITVQKIADGYQWREYNVAFYRKRFTEPDWRWL